MAAVKEIAPHALQPEHLRVAAYCRVSSDSDQAGISAFARTAMAWANAEGLITSTSGSLLSPKGTATRAQTAMILMRFCQKV